MKVIAAISFYDEPVENLVRLIDSMKGFVDMAVFADGVYEGFEGSAHSGSDVWRAITRACGEAGIICDVYLDANARQTEKRTRLMERACFYGKRHEDWILVIDADEHLDWNSDFAGLDDRDDARPNFDANERGYDAATVTIKTLPPDDFQPALGGVNRPGTVHKPRLFRMLDNMMVGPIHHGAYAGRDKKGELVNLKDRGGYLKRLGARDARTLDLTEEIRITNTTWSRSPERLAAKHAYSIVREREGYDL